MSTGGKVGFEPYYLLIHSQALYLLSYNPHMPLVNLNKLFFFYSLSDPPV